MAGKFKFDDEKKYYETFYGKGLEVKTKNATIHGRLEKVRIKPEEDNNLFIYVREAMGSLLKIRHEDVVDIKEDTRVREKRFRSSSEL